MNLWILTEERPKIETIKEILTEFVNDNSLSAFLDNLRIIPILSDSRFTFLYELLGFRCNAIDKIYVKIVSGEGSFVDYLVFYQDNEPKITDTPFYLVEETKTDDSESRNTGVYQRCSKFIYADYFYPNTKKIMLYNLKHETDKPTDTNVFGTKMLLTSGIKIIGKDLNESVFKSFSNIEELISFKASMRKAPKGNVPIEITQNGEVIYVSGRLVKSGTLSHDPNIGALTMIANTLRKLGWNKKIVITKHGLEQRNLTNNNKFVLISNILNIELDGLSVPKSKLPNKYWHYETKGEKLGTIFVHLVVENFTSGYSIFENHAGCEKGYFLTADGTFIPLKKYTDAAAYKLGDKTKRLSIPDLILIDLIRSEIVNAEGKKYQFKNDGINELALYDGIEEEYIKKYYPGYKIIRTVILYGSDKNTITEIEIGFLLNEKGVIILGINPPRILIEAVNNLISFWRK